MDSDKTEAEREEERLMRTIERKGRIGAQPKKWSAAPAQPVKPSEPTPATTSSPGQKLTWSQRQKLLEEQRGPQKPPEVVKGSVTTYEPKISNVYSTFGSPSAQRHVEVHAEVKVDTPIKSSESKQSLKHLMKDLDDLMKDDNNLKTDNELQEQQREKQKQKREQEAKEKEERERKEAEQERKEREENERKEREEREERERKEYEKKKERERKEREEREERERKEYEKKKERERKEREERERKEKEVKERRERKEKEEKEKRERKEREEKEEEEREKRERDEEEARKNKLDLETALAKLDLETSISELNTMFEVEKNQIELISLEELDLELKKKEEKEREEKERKEAEKKLEREKERKRKELIDKVSEISSLPIVNEIATISVDEFPKQRICSACQKAIENDNFLSLSNEYFHKECMICSRCHRNMAVCYRDNDRSLFCTECSLEGTDVCGKCGKSVHAEFLNAVGLKWHIECFVCTQCGNKLSESFDEFENKPFCSEDCVALFRGHICKTCKKPCVGRYLGIGDSFFHKTNDCFRCALCDDTFADFVYYEIEDKAYCENCAHKVTEQ